MATTILWMLLPTALSNWKRRFAPASTCANVKNNILKIKIKRTGSGSGATSLSGFWIGGTTTVSDWNDNAPPVIDYADINLKNIKDGSNWSIRNPVTDEYQEGTQSGTGDVELKCEVLGEDNPFDINVRKGTAAPKYEPFRTRPRITGDGSDVWVEQIAVT